MLGGEEDLTGSAGVLAANIDMVRDSKIKSPSEDERRSWYPGPPTGCWPCSGHGHEDLMGRECAAGPVRVGGGI